LIALQVSNCINSCSLMQLRARLTQVMVMIALSKASRYKSKGK
jgi:hypothetical protein